MAGTVTITSREMIQWGKGQRKTVEKITIDATGDAADGSFPAKTITGMYGYVFKVVTNPGSTAPTANYDIVLNDPDDAGLDAMGGLIINRHTSNGEQVYPNASGATIPIFLCGDYSLAITNNSVNSATTKIIFYLADDL